MVIFANVRPQTYWERPVVSDLLPFANTACMVILKCQLLTGAGWDALNLLLYHWESIAKAKQAPDSGGEICPSGLYMVSD